MNNAINKTEQTRRAAAASVEDPPFKGLEKFFFLSGQMKLMKSNTWEKKKGGKIGRVEQRLQTICQKLQLFRYIVYNNGYIKFMHIAREPLYQSSLEKSS